MQGGFPNIRHMRVFLETVRSGSVSTAAEQCHLSQPATTQALTRLEEDIGTPLLVRKRKRVAPTRCGELFAVRAEMALHHLKVGAQLALREGGEATRRRKTFEMSVTASQLRNLIEIAQSGSFTIAAKSLGLSQPTVHRAARSLEAVAGLPFFAARSYGVQLTPAAEAFVVGAKLAHSEIRHSLEELGRELGQECGTFILGSLPLARTTIVPRALHAMANDVEGFQVRVVEGRYAELLRSLREGEIDGLIGALRNPPPAEDVTQELLFQDALAVVAHPDHPLANRRNIALEDLHPYPWIAPPKETPAGQFLFEILNIGERAETPVRIVSSSMAILRGVLAEGPYLSVVSRHQINVDERLGAIAALDVPLSGHLRDIGLTFRAAYRPTATQARFIDFLRKHAQAAKA